MGLPAEIEDLRDDEGFFFRHVHSAAAANGREMTASSQTSCICHQKDHLCRTQRRGQAGPGLTNPTHAAVRHDTLFVISHACTCGLSRCPRLVFPLIMSVGELVCDPFSPASLPSAS